MVVVQLTCYVGFDTHPPTKLSPNIHHPAISHCLIPLELHEHTDNQVTIANWSTETLSTS